ncbi:MAG TPA: YHS domain-containing protein [Chromatiales bacterium]|nr:YHS domain-containing protein [Chromatiales bacterium]
MVAVRTCPEGHASHCAGAETKHTDPPVCGMGVDGEKGYGNMHEDRLYRFCSWNCLDRFEVDPGKYLDQPAESRGGES